MNPIPAAPYSASVVLEAAGVHVGYGHRRRGAPAPNPVLRGFEVHVRRGECVALVGTNGCGKTTALHVLAGLLVPERGTVVLNERDGARADLAQTPRRAVARRLAILHQTLPPMPGVTVRQLVAQGRLPHRGALGMLAGADGPEVEQAMASAGVQPFADRAVDTLSGGERQRARLALALAQQPEVMLLDEPTAYLDVAHQLRMLQLVRTLQERHQLTVVVVLHDLEHAARFADRIVALRDGRVAADGAPEAVLTADLLAEVFGVRGRVIRDDHDGRLRCLLEDPLDAPSR